MPDYKLISADSHINEPPDLWTTRLPAKFQDRAPRMVDMERGSAWIMEGAVDPINFGLNVCGGTPPELQSPWIKWADVRKGGYVPAERLKEQDQDGVSAEVLYPTPRVSNTVFWHTEDPEFHLACIRAYNDWLSEYCSQAPDRLLGVALMPNIGIVAAVEEFRRVAKLPGIRSIQLGRYPSGGFGISEEDDPLWAEAEAAGTPVSIHVSFALDAPGAHSRTQANTVIVGGLRFFDAPVRAQEFIYSLALDRFPKLMIPLVEVDCGWVPYVKEQLNDRFSRQNPKTRPQTKLRPSEYFERNFYYAYITDAFGVHSRHFIGVDQIMWSSDFPHTGTDFPNSWKTIEQHYVGVPEDEKYKMLAGNASRIYGLNGN